MSTTDDTSKNIIEKIKLLNGTSKKEEAAKILENIENYLENLGEIKDKMNEKIDGEISNFKVLAQGVWGIISAGHNINVIQEKLENNVNLASSMDDFLDSLYYGS
jgi:hypothetical protein